MIDRVAYDKPARQLLVRFVNGRTYRYDGVPPEIAAGLDVAPSKGQFFNRAIRDRFPFVRRRSSGR